MQHTSSTRSRTGPPDRQWSAVDRQRFAEACREAEDTLSGTRHSADLLLYFKYLVARGFENGSFVDTQPRLAAAMGVSSRTIREWDNHLDRLGLIWRTKEGVSYRRHITRFAPPPAPLDDAATHHEPSADTAPITDPDALLALAAEALAAGDQERGQALAFQAAMAKAGLLAEPEAVTFFAPDNAEEEIRSERKDHSDPSFKQTQASSGGGEVNAIPDTETVRVLQAAGTWIPDCLRELADRPVEEARQAVALAKRVREPGDPGALAVYFHRLIRDGVIAPAPKQRSAPPRVRAAPAPALGSPDDPASHAHYLCPHDQVRGACPQCYVEQIGGSLLENAGG